MFNFDQSFNETMSPRSSEQNEAQRAQTRALILQTALQAFAERGYASASMSFIAQQAGVSKGLAYHYFKNKEDLLIGIFEMLAGLADGLEEAWEGKTVAQKLHMAVDLTFEILQTQPQIVRFMTALALQPEVTESLKEHIESQKLMNIKVYQGLFKELGYADPETEAYAFGAMLDGVALGYLALGDLYPMNEMKTLILTKYKL